MAFDPDIRYRHSIRLKDYDYSQSGGYFVTVCTQGRECLFGQIANGAMILNEYGQIVRNVWNELTAKFPNVELDEWIIMPNHMHGIIIIVDRVGAGSPRPQSGQNEGAETAPLRIPLGKIIAYFKYQSTKRINNQRKTPAFPVWQRNYYEHIIRDENDLDKIREYIVNNPLQWTEDENNPVNF